MTYTKNGGRVISSLILNALQNADNPLNLYNVLENSIADERAGSLLYWISIV